MNDVSDIRDALAQLDRRLGEIRQHVGRLLQDDERPPAGGPGPAPEPEPESPAPEPAAPEASATDAAAPEAVVRDATPEPSPEPEISAPISGEPAAASGPDLSEEVAPASGAGDRDTADAQIQKLRELRAELMKGTRELVHSYELQLDALEATFASAPPPAPVFDGTVRLLMTNVSGIAALAEVEAAVRRLDDVERAGVTRYAGQDADIEITLARPTELVAPLSDALPKSSAIRTITGDEIVVELEALDAE